jgi:hypothetical protein
MVSRSGTPKISEAKQPGYASTPICIAFMPASAPQDLARLPLNMAVSPLPQIAVTQQDLGHGNAGGWTR